MHSTDLASKNWLISTFQSLQIVCLEQTSYRLYAEVVQTVEVKRTCWVRPLVLVEQVNDLSLCSDELVDCSKLYDLRQGSDLLLPTILFRAAIDTEVIPVLAQLGGIAESKSSTQEARLRLNQFVREVCLAHPEIFANEVTKNDNDRLSNAP